MKKSAAGRWRIAIVFLLMVFFLGASGYNPAKAASVKKTTLVVGQKKVFKKKGAVWTSKRPSVVSITSDGTATALRKGNATVVAKVGKKKYTYKVKVEAPVLTQTQITLPLSKMATIKVKGTTMKFGFASSDPSVVSVKKVKKNKIKIKAIKDGDVEIIAHYKGVLLTCKVKSGKGSNPGPTQFDLVYQGRVIQTLKTEKSDAGNAASNVSRYGQSAPLYLNVNGGDGLESIYAQTNNGNVNVEGVQLSPEAVQGTINKACTWARLVCESPSHGYDDGQTNEIDCWGIAKANAPGTGDYCCFSLAECAFYFAGVNLLGECLGNPAAAIYPPYSTMLFEHGGVSIWGDTEPRPASPRGSVHIFPKCGFTSIGKQSMYLPGDIAISFFGGQQHMELVLQAGTASTCQVAEAYGPGSGGRTGGDQSGSELCVKTGFYKPGSISYVFRFTGAGVVLNTVGLNG